ncbi:unnamed protein product [Prunus armeniaca]
MVKCDFQQQLGQPKFQRLYVCLGAAKEGFKAGILFKAKSLRDKFWETSYATTVPHFTRVMEDLKKLSNDAYEWLTTLDKPPRHWSKSHFNTHLKDRPILSMFEFIRCKLMRRIQGRREKMLKWNRPICPRIFKKVEGNKAKAGACVAMWSGGGKFQVSAGGHAQYIVDLELRTCSRRAWDLQKWHCVHAIAAINYKGGLNVIDFVDDYYLTTTYLKTYDNLILPMNGMDINEEEGEHKGKMKMRVSSNQAEIALSSVPNTHDSIKCRGTENTQTIIDSSYASTLVGGPSTLKKRCKPPRRVQKGKPLPKPSKKGHATSKAQPTSTSCPYASTYVSTVGSNVVEAD